jgi:hypothetical protein
MLDMKNPDTSAPPDTPAPDLQGSAIDPAEPERLEAQIARDHAQIAASVAALKDHLAPDALLRRGAVLARRQIAGAARSVGDTVRDNPLAAGLVLAGVAWLILGRKPVPAAPEPPLAGSKFESLARWEDEGGPPSPESEPDPDPEDDWLDEARALRARSTEALKKLEAASRSAPAAQTVADRAALMAAYSADLAQALRRGLGGFSAAAQDRIVAARDAAFHATETTRSLAGGAVKEHPLLSGLISMLAGAGLGAWLRIGAREKEVLGPVADSLIDTARRLYEAERDRAEDLAADAVAGLQEEMAQVPPRRRDRKAPPPG